MSKVERIITALPDAPTGSVTKTTEADFLSTFKQNSPSLQTSAVLCRNNAPLIKQALTCLRSSIPCRIEGKDVGKQLTSLIKKLNATDTRQLSTSLSAYRAEQQSKLSPWKFEQLDDKLSCLSLLLSNFTTPHPISSLEKQIDELFSDYNPTLPSKLTFSSVHKSKGLEWPTVYLLGRNLYMPSRYATQP